MIRINLLGIKKEVAKSRGVPAVSVEGAKASIVFALIFVLAVGGLAAHYLMLSRDAERLDQEVKQQEAEKARLARVKSELEQFEKRSDLLKRRIALIENLKRNQTGPVNVLNALQATVEASGTLWLTNFDNNAGKINIDGIATSVNTVADFITNLKRSGQFRNVEIRESLQEERFKEATTFIFSITAELPPVQAEAASGSGARKT